MRLDRLGIDGENENTWNAYVDNLHKRHVRIRRENIHRYGKRIKPWVFIQQNWGTKQFFLLLLNTHPDGVRKYRK